MFKVLGKGSFGSAVKHIITNSNLPLTDQNYKFIIPAVPSYAVPEVLEKESIDRLRKNNITIIFVSKGFLYTGELLGEWANHKRLDWAVFAGPHFASELQSNLPTYSMLGYEKEIPEIKNWSNMNVMLSTDKIAIQLLGALKNIYACFFGIIAGLELGRNYTASMFTFVLKEIQQIFDDMHLNQEAIYSYAGISDLILTCTSSKSRNYKEGFNRTQSILSNHLSEAKHSAIAFTKRFNSTSKEHKKYQICRFISEVMKLDLHTKSEIQKLLHQYIAI
ncbi:hypothetical protein [Candidatus Cytomitobacter primus]|uniref:Glycerol-3-phosphate dehydrogenase n=1 Tax=Candidatus Cytomitobacter primus TaxID=2066024 RepID=A0A5C0UF84_9PROT|nr:hypothetical protein [Candidatus Cytomitobacter primus]QEK38755.1 hypothetical protein FZC34_02460 [Candidatus Cytomitobacter primus]